MSGSPIRVEFHRSGGLAGIPLAATADADELAAEHAVELRRLLTAEEAPTLPEHTASPSRGADRFQYDLSIDDGQRHRAFNWDETAVPDSVRPLLDTLTRLSRPAPVN
jgi:hypothetical protein